MNLNSLASSAVAGLPGGAAYALAGVGIVLLYQMGGVLSFTQGAIGVFGAVVFAQWEQDGRPFLLALAAGLLLGAAIGGAVGWMMARWFSGRSLMIRSVVTIGCSVSFAALALELYGTNSLTFPFLLQSGQVTVASVVISANTILAVGLAVCLGAGLWALLRFTRLGVWLRAMSDRAATAELLGVPVRSLSVWLWAFSGGLAALAIILISPSQQSDPADLGTLSVEALVAALVGGFSSFGVTIVAGIAIGVFESVVNATSLASYSSLASFAVLIGVLLWRRRGDAWNEAR